MKREIAVIVTTPKQKMLVEMFCESDIDQESEVVNDFKEIINIRHREHRGLKELNINLIDKKLADELKTTLNSCIIFDDGSKNGGFMSDWDLDKEYLQEEYYKEAIEAVKSCELMTFQEFVSKFELEGVSW